MNKKVSTNDREPYQQPITLHSQHDVHELVENDLINWDRNDIVGENCPNGCSTITTRKHC